MLPAWNLRDLYGSPSDNKLKRDRELISAAAETFVRTNRGKISDHARSPKRFLRALTQYESILLQLAKPSIYAGLLFAEDASNERHGAFLQDTRHFASQVYNKLVFFELEIMALPQRTIKSLASAKSLSQYRNYLQKLIQQKRHKLPEEQETLVNDLSLTGAMAFVRLFDQEFSHKQFDIKAGGKFRKVSETEVLHLLSHEKRSTRKEALSSLVQGLKGDLWRLTFIFNTLAGSKQTMDRRRNFALPESARHLDNEVEQKSVDALSSALQQSYRLVQRYYKLKAKLLGLKDFQLYDRYAPLKGSQQRYTFEQARKMVVSAFGNFSSQLAKEADNFFTKRWIDAAKRAGKRGGAFCSFGTPDLHPYIFINFQGNLRDVFTLAHEMGHALHACLMRGQNYLNYDAPLTICESASTFGEMLLFDKLRSESTAKGELAALLAFKIDSIIATVYRQISMYLFEKDFHDLRRKKGELSAAAISEIWQKRQRQLYGSSVKLSPGSEVLWSYIPHFLHTPFYVYAYSYGQLLALIFFARFKEEGSGFARKLSHYYSLGSSKNPGEALKDIGVNLNSSAVWKQGIDIIEQLVGELTVLSRK
ncbi:MAG: M3 family oligoendopeptidase [Deltaproteobacteria bacterium]|nr:M3 family oligoendopeptidase [Deltaproteobacteria bacterium]